MSGLQVEVQKVQKVFEHSHMVQWLEKAVIDNIKGQEVSQFLYVLCQHTSLSTLLSSRQDASINQCITDLKKLAAA